MQILQFQNDLRHSQALYLQQDNVRNLCENSPSSCCQLYYNYKIEKHDVCGQLNKYTFSQAAKDSEHSHNQLCNNSSRALN